MTEERPVTRMELLDGLAWVDALLEAGWMRGATQNWSSRGDRISLYPNLHCLIGAVLVAGQQMTGEGHPWRGEVCRALERALGEALVEAPELMNEQFMKNLKHDLKRRHKHDLQCRLMRFNDEQVDVEPVRALVQRAAARVGSK